MSILRAEIPIREEVGSTPSPEPEEETRAVSNICFRKAICTITCHRKVCDGCMHEIVSTCREFLRRVKKNKISSTIIVAK